MRVKNRTKLSAALCIAVLSTVALASPATADDDSYWEPLRYWLETNGVDDATQQRLVSKAAAGEIFDSLVAENEPISEELSEDGHKLLATFEDGSIIVSEIRPESPSDTRAISGCTFNNGSGYASASGCLIVSGNGMLELRFIANYSWGSFGGTISSAHSPEAVVLYGSATTPTVDILRANSSGNQPAVATAHTYYTHQNGTYSEDLYLSLRVDSGGGWTTQY